MAPQNAIGEYDAFTPWFQKWHQPWVCSHKAVGYWLARLSPAVGGAPAPAPRPSGAPTVLGAILLTTGRLTLGASNATFGVLPQTMIYAVAQGYFLVWVRRQSW